MFRFLYVIFMNFHRAPYIVSKMRYMADHPEKYSDTQRYAMTKHCIYLMNKSGKITTEGYGMENLPKEGGYIMYPNHQGKYDVLGIFLTHQEPCSFVMDKFKSHTMLVREFIDLVQGKRLEINNPRQGISVINEVAQDVANGKKYILFPEGGYFNNKNKVQKFKAGSFKIALKSKVPIVPIAIIDSYKVFNSIGNFGPVTTQVHYLKPIPYEEYKGMKTQELAELVRGRIEEKINEVLASR